MLKLAQMQAKSVSAQVVSCLTYLRRQAWAHWGMSLMDWAEATAAKTAAATEYFMLTVWLVVELLD